MRIISLCVDGIHQAAQRGLYQWLASQDADIICLQDLKALEYELDGDAFQLEGYFAYFFDSGIKHQNGVAIYTREQPKALIFGLGFNSGVDMAGRYLQADFDNISIGSLLAPIAGHDIESQETKAQFFDDMQNHLHKITRKRRQFIFCGDWGMAHKRVDVEHWEDHEHEASFLPEEQKWMDQLFTQLEYSDGFRRVNRDNDEYSWWPTGTIGEGDGLRTDHQVISNSLANRVEHAVFYKTKHFSSHLPLVIDYDLELAEF